MADLEKRCLKIDFSDFWPGFIKDDNYFWKLLSQYYDLEISAQPEVLIYSCYGFQFMNYKCHKIFFTGENVRPDFRECDFAFTFDIDHHPGKHYRLPLYRLYSLDKLPKEKNPEEIMKQKTKFCCMMVSNPNGRERNQFFDMLSKYKKVDSGGGYKNNIGHKVEDKLAFTSEYKFMIAFENTSYPGYTTEKILDPMIVNTIPAYWGNPVIDQEFNTKSFVNVHSYKTFENVIEEIIRIDNDDDLYRKYLSEPYLKDNYFPIELENETIAEKMHEVIEGFRFSRPVGNGINSLYSVGNKIKQKLKVRLNMKPRWHH